MISCLWDGAYKRVADVVAAVDIICLQETWLGTGSNTKNTPKFIKIPGYTSYLTNK